MKNIFLLLLFVLCLVPAVSFSQIEVQQAQVQTDKAYDLSGIFNGGGGKYYIRQIDNNIMWYGEDNATSPSWSNVGCGIIKGEEITLQWADVPKGPVLQKGDLILKIESNDRLVLVTQRGDFFGTDVWERIP
jgi:hypothetical protein